VEKRYLVLSEDSALEVPPVYVTAETVEQALRHYCRKVQSKEGFMRQFVEGQSLDDFIGKLLFTDEQRWEAVSNEQGLPSPPIEVVREKVFRYFSSCPHLGEIYMQFLEKKDSSVLTEPVYEFISERDTSGYTVIEDSTILNLKST